MPDEVIDRLSLFFNPLVTDVEGRLLLEEPYETYHLAVGKRAIYVHIENGRVIVGEAPRSVEARDALTRLRISDRKTLEHLLSGALSFTDIIIPMSAAHGALIFEDNWMVKKNSINRLGQIIRKAQKINRVPSTTQAG